MPRVVTQQGTLMAELSDNETAFLLDNRAIELCNTCSERYNGNCYHAVLANWQVTLKAYRKGRDKTPSKPKEKVVVDGGWVKRYGEQLEGAVKAGNKREVEVLTTQMSAFATIDASKVRQGGKTL